MHAMRLPKWPVGFMQRFERLWWFQKIETVFTTWSTFCKDSPVKLFYIGVVRLI